ncbi:hypothetical protein GCM10027185_40040 [Spirosoma pulveris]
MSLAELGKSYVIIDFGALADSTLVQTGAIQKAIDAAAQQSGASTLPYPNMTVYSILSSKILSSIVKTRLLIKKQ